MRNITLIFLGLALLCTLSSTWTIQQARAQAGGNAVQVTPTGPKTPPIFYQGTGVSIDQSKFKLSAITDTLLPGIAGKIAQFLGAIAVLFLIWAGIQFLTAEGEPDKITQATKTAFYVIAGVLLIVFAYALVYLFLTIFTPTAPPSAQTPPSATDAPAPAAPPTAQNPQ